MNAPAPDHTSSEPGPESEDELCIHPEDVLRYVREQAGRIDPRHADLYRTMSPTRIQDGAELAQRLLATHRTLLGRWGRLARTGRRAHLQQVYRLLRSTNEANVVLAEAYLETAFGTLPPTERP